MNIEESIVTALEYEKKVRDHYLWAAQETDDERSRNFFKTLAKEEQGHVDYLESRLSEWKDRGVISAEPLKTVLPSKEFIE